MSSTREKKKTFVLVLIVALAPSLGTLSALWFWPGSVGGTIYAACKIVLYGIPAIIAFRTMRRIDYHSALRRGLKPKALLQGLGSGVLIGALILAIWYLVLDGTDVSKLLAVVAENGLDDPVKYWLFAAWLCIGNSFLEELTFRWFIDSRLRILGLGTIIALPLSAAIFTLHHVLVLSAYFEPGVVILGSAGVFAGGIIWSCLLMRWKSLVPAWISHALVDLAIFIIGASILGL